ncbi:chloride channel-like protein 3 [Plenodomus tracheiphilus IPT5]|uniref:Chloride channel protein n=1 Tax=Plenodomus tracheiphilus IPT5 TaxID=1408161 RepID=A0A6A7BNX0_9PLEO|nr:chloride channel-like protein 3 [Plenodomus tracheiphilus IPT5]
MSPDDDATHEHTPLLHQTRLSQLQHSQDEEAQSTISSTLTKEEQQLSGSTIGERLPYNDYTTIDWLHDLVKDSYRFRTIQSQRGIRCTLLALFDAGSGWLAVVLIGALTACVAFVVDVAVATVSDWKGGYCSNNIFRNREACCASEVKPYMWRKSGLDGGFAGCKEWHVWVGSYKASFAVYVGVAFLFGVVSSSATMVTRRELPFVGEGEQSVSTNKSTNKSNSQHTLNGQASPAATSGGKVMYMAAGSGIPEIKTILSGFTIPSFLSLPVLLTKAFGAIFAVSTGMCLGKEGPFVHISTCIGHLIGSLFPKYRTNGRKMRELLSAACSSGLSVAFGAPIGGVLFSYEEISTYFPRKVLWRAFLCSLVAAMVLRELNPMGTGKLVLFETNYGTEYSAVHYLVFVLLGAAGGVFGGLFCKLNFLWSKWFRSFGVIKRNPVLEVALVVLVTAVVQFPNPLTREPGDVIIKNLLVDCDGVSRESWVCRNEDPTVTNWPYTGWLVYGTLAKLVLTVITFGIKVPSGVIIPALDAGAFFGRLVGQLIPSISPGNFAMVGAAAFLAGVSRMTISLAVIMFELTGQLSYVVPHMLAILVAKWVADAISSEGVYDLAQNVLGHPFLDPDTAIGIVRKRKMCAEVLIPPKRTMDEITVQVPETNKVPYALLEQKLGYLRQRGLMDAGLVLVQSHGSSSIPILQGYISQSELEFGLTKLVPSATHAQPDFDIRLLGPEIDDAASPESLEIDLTPFVDRTPLSICAKAPLEYAVEMFSKLGLRYLCVTEEGTGALVGVIIKKRLVGFLEHLKDGGVE